MKLTREDIDKYGTDEEKKLLEINTRRNLAISTDFFAKFGIENETNDYKTGFSEGYMKGKDAGFEEGYNSK